MHFTSRTPYFRKPSIMQICTMDNLTLFFSKIKELTFWQRIFGWRAVRKLSYDAFQEFRQLADKIRGQGEKLDEQKNDLTKLRTEKAAADQQLQDLQQQQIRKDGAITFKSHAFMNTSEKDNRYGVKFSQLHAVRLEDMNGDGLKDIITGKTFWAHGPTKDPEPNQPAVVYWFELKRDGKRVDWIPHLMRNRRIYQRNQLLLSNSLFTFYFR